MPGIVKRFPGARVWCEQHVSSVAEEGVRPPMPEQPLLSARDISKQYHDGHVQALSHVDLDVHEREYLVVMGPSGSGKSTLLHILGGIDRPTHGEVFFRGQPISGLKSLSGFRAKELGFVFQTFHLFPTLNASRNVQIPMFTSSLTPREREAKAGRVAGSRGAAAPDVSPSQGAVVGRETARGHRAVVGQ